MKIAIVGAGWSGLAAAVAATATGHQVTVFEAARTLGGRARGLPASLPDGRSVQLDNGQHILIGAYEQTLRLLCSVGVDLESTLLRLPLTLQFPDGSGLCLPWGRAPWDALSGIARARGWDWRDKLSLLKAATLWQWHGFTCAPELTVQQLCRSLRPRLMQTLIEPLCVSALNTPAAGASAKVFLRVLQDSLFSAPGGSNLLLPRIDLCALFPQAAADWLAQRGARLALGQRVSSLQHLTQSWQIDDEGFDQVVLATGARHASQLLERSAAALPPALTAPLQRWQDCARALQHEAITTVYAWGQHARLAKPMLALRSDAQQPAQFAFDRGQLGGPEGLIALVVSASTGQRDAIQAQVLAQARAQLGLSLQAVQTITEKQATFACNAGLTRPPMEIAPGLRACGDYVDGPYPATLEGAVRSGLNAVSWQAKPRTMPP
jgi:squalene-associated FAD-dependent desaturase